MVNGVTNGMNGSMSRQQAALTGWETTAAQASGALFSFFKHNGRD
jgi:hypothetical protein